MLGVWKPQSCFVSDFLIELSDRTPLAPLGALMSAVSHVVGEVPVLLLGAAARDLLLVHVHGVEVHRATEDTDLALAISDWDAFRRIREGLVLSKPFKATRLPHRFWFRQQRVDIVPFGGVERSDHSIAWPPDGSEMMNVIGLNEALANAVHVRLPGPIVARVTSLPAMSLLKTWAWRDRRYRAPGKDASDLWLLLQTYCRAGNEDRLYEDERDALAAYEFDMEAAGAWLLGKDGRGVLAHGSGQRELLGSLNTILRPEIDPDGALSLVTQMPVGNRERQLALLAAFHAGLFDSRP
jgi:predicted nucleotidyltransferase